MKDEALKLALEDAKRNERHHTAAETRYWLNQYKLIAEQAVNAIKQTFQAPVQEPVAWTVSGKITDWSKDFSAYQTKHYTRPVYTPPAAQRQWVGLTDEEVGDLSDFAYANDEEFVRNVEAKLKDKNAP